MRGGAGIILPTELKGALRREAQVVREEDDRPYLRGPDRFPTFPIRHVTGRRRLIAHLEKTHDTASATGAPSSRIMQLVAFIFNRGHVLDAPGIILVSDYTTGA